MLFCYIRCPPFVNFNQEIFEYYYLKDNKSRVTYRQIIINITKSQYTFFIFLELLFNRKFM
jgi:hypothetical protein